MIYKQYDIRYYFIRSEILIKKFIVNQKSTHSNRKYARISTRLPTSHFQSNFELLN